MGGSEEAKASADVQNIKRNGRMRMFDPEFPTFLVQLPHKIQNSFKAQLQRAAKDNAAVSSALSIWRKDKGLPTALEADLEKQLQVWKENPDWNDQPPEIKVSTPKGSLCNLNVKVNVGLPPDAVYNIVTDPDNKRVFKNIKEVISRRVLVDEGLRQVVELEQAALWKFLWWSGTISVHVLVDQNREDYSMAFKQVKTGFMKKFEGRWKVEPIFVDEKLCFPLKPKSWKDYHSCTGGKGRIGSKVSLEQLIEPAIVPPPPISWYLRGITTRTAEMLITDLLAESARIRGGTSDTIESPEQLDACHRKHDEEVLDNIQDIKDRWAMHRRNAKKQQRMQLSSKSSTCDY